MDELRGRRRERADLDRLLDAAREGESGVRVLRGEAGIGKTALLLYARGQASGFRVLRAVGVESEMEFPFAALQQLCVPLLDRLASVPEPQSSAIETAFGLSAGVPRNRFLVGLGVLSLLSEAAQHTPILCLVDDAQWLDQASSQSLAFAARRLEADAVAMLVARRDPSAGDDFAGLPELRLGPLPDAESKALLAAAVHGPLDDRVADRIVAEAHGNPLALLELARPARPADLAGGFAVVAGLPASGVIEESFRRRLESLPEETRLLLLLAAAEPLGEQALLWAAAASLGLGTEAAAPAEAEDLLEVGGRITFRHPLVRSASYKAATPDERRRVHGALAKATNAEIDPDRRAWHRAHATAGLDDIVADELERSARRARSRGGLAAAAAFLERATELTAAPGARVERALAAAQAKHQAGASDAALRLLAIAEAGPAEEVQRARAERLRAQIVFAVSRDATAPPLLLSAARRLEPFDSGLARETYLEALEAATMVGRRDLLAEVGAALRAALSSASRPAFELLLTGQALLMTEGYPAGTDLLKRALDAYRSEPVTDENQIGGLWLACHVAKALWDDESWNALSERYIHVAREIGALTELPRALDLQAELRVYRGDFELAAALLDEARALTEATGGAPVLEATSLLLAVYRDDEGRALAHVEELVRQSDENAQETLLSYAEYAVTVLFNGLGRYDDAVAAAERSRKHHAGGGFGRLLSELVEAAARSGHTSVAADALQQLVDRTRLGGSDWALGLEAVARALLSDGDDAEHRYREAIERLGRTQIRLSLARAQLVYGEWLRRERRRTDAREQLRAAHDLFDSIGATSFAARAAVELLATGEHARKRDPHARPQLTPQEFQIAQLATEGLSNSEIASRLFISSSTVAYHLAKVFRKLDIGSRTQLHRFVPERPERVSAPQA